MTPTLKKRNQKGKREREQCSLVRSGTNNGVSESALKELYHQELSGGVAAIEV